MSPAKPGGGRARKGRGKSQDKIEVPAAPLKSVVCRTCGRRIRIPDGWTVGPAVRRHYWAKHRDVMLPPKKKGRA